jgi:leader peptidase (prepilin peptidase)/N-methyltransferase
MTVPELLAASPGLWIAVAGLLGLLVGSFLNVVIHRLPKMLERRWQAEYAALGAADAGAPTLVADRYDLIAPRSACPSCLAPIRALENLPVLSWLWLRGRCAACGAPISLRYPLVELGTALLSAAVAWRFGFGPAAAAGLVVTWFLVALAAIDLDTQLLPDDLTLPLLWLGLAASLWTPAVGASGLSASLPVDTRSSVEGAIAGYLSLWSVYQLFRLVTGKEGMGFGDFKLLAALGAWLGWQMLLPIVLFAALVGATVGIVLILVRGRERHLPMAFGPYLAAAGWITLMFGPPLVDRYLGLFRAR